MSETASLVNPARAPLVRAHETRKGALGMLMFIATEATLFLMLFFAYFYLAAINSQWPLHEDPTYKLALVLLAILVTSSFTAHWGQRGIEHGQTGRLKVGLILTLALGVAFLVVQYFEYNEHLKKLTPQESAYGSIFFTITSFHLAHVILGFVMLSFVLVRAFAGHFSRERHLAVKNVVLYWHFVDVVWVFVVSILYLSPQFYGASQ